MGTTRVASGIASCGMPEWNDGHALSDCVRAGRIGRVQRLRRRLASVRAGRDPQPGGNGDRANIEGISQGSSAGAVTRGGASRQGFDSDTRACSSEGRFADDCRSGRESHKRTEGREFEGEWPSGRAPEKSRCQVASSITRLPSRSGVSCRGPDVVQESDHGSMIAPTSSAGARMRFTHAPTNGRTHGNRL